MSNACLKLNISKGEATFKLVEILLQNIKPKDLRDVKLSVFFIMYNHQHANTGNVQLQCRSTARVLGRHTSPPEFLKDHLHPNEVSSNQTQECDSDENKYPPCQPLISSHLLLFISHSESTKTVSVSLLMTHSVSFLLLCFVFLFIFFSPPLSLLPTHPHVPTLYAFILLSCIISISQLCHPLLRYFHAANLHASYGT